MKNILRKILNLISILRIYYGHSLLAIIKVMLRLANQCHQEWARLTFNFLKVKVKILRGNHPLKEGKTMVYANHRSQADFFLDNVLLNYQTNFLSRMAVLIACPAFILSHRSVWFFNRGKRSDPERFNQWLDNKYRNSGRPGLLVYPEGHRMQGIEKILPEQLKTGMIKYAYRRKLPSQILITFGNQNILDQKRLHVSFGQTVYYKLSGVIDPADYQSQNQYIQTVRAQFCSQFDQAFAQYKELRQRGQ